MKPGTQVELQAPYGQLKRDEGRAVLIIVNGAYGHVVETPNNSNDDWVWVDYGGSFIVPIPQHWLKTVR